MDDRSVFVSLSIVPAVSDPMERFLATFCLMKHTLFFWSSTCLKKVEKIVANSEVEAVIPSDVRLAILFSFKER